MGSCRCESLDGRLTNYDKHVTGKLGGIYDDTTNQAVYGQEYNNCDGYVCFV
jgi:hypothetical protein